MSSVGHTAHMGDMRSAYKILVRKPEWKTPLARPRHRRVDNTKMDWVQLAQDWAQ